MSRARKSSKSNGTQEEKAKSSGTAAAPVVLAEPLFFRKDNVLSELDFDLIVIGEPSSWTPKNGNPSTLYPLAVSAASGTTRDLAFRSPYLHTGAGHETKLWQGGRPSDTLKITVAGKAVGPDKQPNFVKQFLELIKQLDKNIIAIAASNRILGEDMEPAAYEQCYKPMVYTPQEEKASESIQFGLYRLFGKPQWAVWDSNKKEVKDEAKQSELLFDRLIAVDFVIPHIYLRSESGRLVYGVKPKITDILLSSDAYNADYKKSRTVEKCPF